MIPLDVDINPPLSLSSDVCVIMAAQRYDIAPDLLLAVRSVERGKPGQSVLNTNGTSDFNEPGLNTTTIRKLTKQGWNEQRLINDSCYAMHASAHWMRIKLLDGSLGEPLLARAARYNSATPVYNVRYQGMLKGPLRDWSCQLHQRWKLPPDALFAVASKVITENELRTCQPKLRLS
jgi:hypothetical protein